MSEFFIPQIITITDGHEHGFDLENYQFTNVKGKDDVLPGQISIWEYVEGEKEYAEALLPVAA